MHVLYIAPFIFVNWILRELPNFNNLEWSLVINQEHRKPNWGGGAHRDLIFGAPLITRGVTHRFHNRYSKYSILLEERNPFLKEPEQVVDCV